MFKTNLCKGVLSVLDNYFYYKNRTRIYSRSSIKWFYG